MEALYIEDNPIEQRLMQLYLQDMGITLHLAGNGSDGLAQARQVLPSFILMDIQLPDMDGITLLQLLQATPLLDKIPVIVTTADLLAQEKYNILETGIKACLNKPVTREKLGIILRQLF